MTYENYQKFVLPLLKNHGAENFTTVAIVREPIEWFSSWYRYYSKLIFKNENYFTGNISFEEYANSYCIQQDSKLFNFKKQSQIILNGQNKNLISHLFKYNAKNDKLVNFLEKKLERTIHLPYLNISPKNSLNLSKKTKNELSNVFLDDYKLYKMAQK